jgi:hypothetical protein
MPKTGSLSRKRETLEMWGALSTRPDADSAALLAAGDQEQTKIYYEVIRFYVDDILRKTLEICCDRLRSSNPWTTLAKAPSDFNAVLERHVKGIERCMKLLHGIPDHRPAEKEARDQRLVELKSKHPDFTDGQIAVKYNSSRPKQEIDAKIVQIAIARQEERTARQRKYVVERAQAAAATYLTSHSLTDQEVLQKLPTPDDVLDLLIEP